MVLAGQEAVPAAACAAAGRVMEAEGKAALAAASAVDPHADSAAADVPAQKCHDALTAAAGPSVPWISQRAAVRCLPWNV